MTTVILVGLIVVLLAAAAYVGVLLLRRTRSARRAHRSPATNAPGRSPTWSARRTDAGGRPVRPGAVRPRVPRQDGVAVPDAPRGSRTAAAASAGPAAGDARRAASRSATPRGGAPPG